ncbi:hypothetical protein EVAR_82842_1 [Eumeta japonica]|uniref:Uncharacterized protein n=1 Tax=Eumeta variegata TaxID=151549 RepID=A0A4C1V4S0_EUMVA|nr:hypothetical protein EVAR_82842_1 [Eumeta japonica]
MLRSNCSSSTVTRIKEDLLRSPYTAANLYLLKGAIFVKIRRKNIREANEQESHQGVGGRRRPWTFATLDESPVRGSRGESFRINMPLIASVSTNVPCVIELPSVNSWDGLTVVPRQRSLNLRYEMPLVLARWRPSYVTSHKLLLNTLKPWAHKAKIFRRDLG